MSHLASTANKPPTWCVLSHILKKDFLTAPKILLDCCLDSRLATVAGDSTLRAGPQTAGDTRQDWVRALPLEAEYGKSRQDSLSGAWVQKGSLDSGKPTSESQAADGLLFLVFRLKPSADCGPFRGLPSFIQSIYSWIDTLSRRSGYLWVVWIYQNLIGSVHFFFILTLIVLWVGFPKKLMGGKAKSSRGPLHWHETVPGAFIWETKQGVQSSEYRMLSTPPVKRGFPVKCCLTFS